MPQQPQGPMVAFDCGDSMDLAFSLTNASFSFFSGYGLFPTPYRRPLPAVTASLPCADTWRPRRLSASPSPGSGAWESFSLSKWGLGPHVHKNLPVKAGDKIRSGAELTPLLTQPPPLAIHKASAPESTGSAAAGSTTYHEPSFTVG